MERDTSDIAKSAKFNKIRLSIEKIGQIVSKNRDKVQELVKLKDELDKAQLKVQSFT